ncbi:Pyr redox 2 domain-containing protein [Abeliophyllum distichum]|uniref:Pyr redox 2 domain-containing protein n=1 Tax=Abeliophyllum distichum TaxID=126358 RepID=A0ABD1TJN7_9LAMI
MIADHLITKRILSVIRKRKLLNTIGFVVASFALMALPRFRTSGGVVFCSSLALGLLALGRAGFAVYHMDVAPRLLRKLVHFKLEMEIEELTRQLQLDKRMRSGVHLACGIVKDVQPQKIILSDGIDIPYGLLVWSIGVGPSPFVNSLDIPKAPVGRIGVDEWLRVPFVQDVFAVGVVGVTVVGFLKVHPFCFLFSSY